MKTKIYFTTILVTSVFTFFSCDKEDSDTIKPVIDLHEPAEGQALLIGSEKGVHFEINFCFLIYLLLILKYIFLFTNRCLQSVHIYFSQWA